MNYEIKIIQSMFIDCNCYLIKNNETNILIDPCVNIDTLKKYGVNNVNAIFITHGHVDHILYLKQIVNKFNCIIYFTEKCLEKIYDDNLNLSSMFNYSLKIDKNSFKYKFVYDNDIIDINNLKFKIITTPGHTNCSISILLENNLFTGDTLFNSSIGRTDFPTGNTLQLLSSLKKILSFKCNFVIYPGHGMMSTVDDELKNNNYLKF